MAMIELHSGPFTITMRSISMVWYHKSLKKYGYHKKSSFSVLLHFVFCLLCSEFDVESCSGCLLSRVRSSRYNWFHKVDKDWVILCIVNALAVFKPCFSQKTLPLPFRWDFKLFSQTNCVPCCIHAKFRCALFSWEVSGQNLV